MSFLNPWAFLWAATAVPVVLLYFLKLRRKKVRVSSTWLWVRSIQDLRVNAPFQRLRRSLLLLLQLLLILLATLAISHPTGLQSPSGEKRWVLLIDRSASMQAKDVAPSRLEKAKETARGILKGCGPGDEVMIIAFSTQAQVMTPFTTSRRDAERAIDLIGPADTTTRLQEAFRIAVSAVQPFKNREIVVLSDGRFEPVQGSAEGVEVRFIPIGAVVRNAAITALDVRRPVRAEDPWTVFVQLDLFHDRELEVPVELYVNSGLKAIKKVKMAPHSNGAVLFDVTKPDPEVVEVKLALEDDLDVDNRAWFVVRQDRAKVLLAGAGNFFLEKAIAQVKDVDAFRTDDLAKVSFGEYDIAVLDGIVPETLPEGRYLLLGGWPRWEGVKADGESAHPVVADWDRRHPVSRMIDFSGLSIRSAPKLEIPGFAAPLVEAPDTPLVFTWERGRTRAIVVTFQVLESDWPLRLSFPLFVTNALTWLRDEGKTHPRPGEPLRIHLRDNESEAELTTPRGKRHKVVGENGGDVAFGDTDACGLYTVIRPEGNEAMALNLFDPRESGGTVEKELRLGTGSVTGANSAIPAHRAFWPWFAAAVLLILIGEWYVYHRRIEI